MIEALIRLLARMSLRFLPKPIRNFDNAIANRWREFRYRDWSITEGKVHRIEVWEEEFKWVAELSYSYSVEGEYQSGANRWSFFRESEADEFARSFPGGIQLFIRYDASSLEDQPF